ncbi:MAG: hypothetical protein ACXVEE_02860 [Polyangiales bacterium]
MRWSLVLGCLLVTSAAHAAEGDGAYGRTDGDASFVVGVDGGTLGGRKLVGGDLRLRYLDTAGVAVGYEELDAFNKAQTEGEFRRDFRAGVELRPLFPARFLKAHEIGNSFVDLVIDSVGLDIGAIWIVRAFKDVPRPGMYVGLALEVPLASRANGPWVRLAGSFRWTASRLEGEDDPNGRVFAFTVGLAWHQLFGAHLVDRRDSHIQ